MSKHIAIFIVTILSSALTFAQIEDLSELLSEYNGSKNIENGVSRYEKLGERQGIELDFNANKLIKTAKKYLGTPHCMGGRSKECIDCSGLLYATFNDLGVKMPHGSEAISKYGDLVYNMEQLKKGDLVFFIETYNTTKFITHSGIYLGNNEFIHTSSKMGVEIRNLRESAYWRDKYIFGTRIF